jgi:hypothetical protein
VVVLIYTCLTFPCRHAVVVLIYTCLTFPCRHAVVVSLCVARYFSVLEICALICQ